MPLLIGRDRTKDGDESSDEATELALGLKDSYIDPNKYSVIPSSMTTVNTPKHKKFGLFRKDSKRESGTTSHRNSTRLSKNIDGKSSSKEDKKESSKKKEKKQVKWIELKEIITF